MNVYTHVNIYIYIYIYIHIYIYTYAYVHIYTISFSGRDGALGRPRLRAPPGHEGCLAIIIIRNNNTNKQMK